MPTEELGAPGVCIWVSDADMCFPVVDRVSRNEENGQSSNKHENEQGRKDCVCV